jgi:pimeloyl-ACP methyl ester carboxylesterase
MGAARGTTYVVVHGAGDTGASWELVAAELRTRGGELIAPDLPCEDDRAGWSEYADVVVRAAGDRRDLVVVGHSLGGFTAPIACTRLPARLLVLVAGMVPVPGETGMEWWTTTGHDEAAAGGDGEDDDAVYLHDVPPAVAARARACWRGQSSTPLLEPWPLPAWPDVPTRYLLGRGDRLFPAAWCRRLVRDRLGIEPDEIDSGHMPFLSRPRELAERLIAYRAALG